MNVRRVLATTLLLTAFALHAQDHPMEAKGFNAGKVYDLHDIDSINTLNGNLVIQIPIGPKFAANGRLSYRLMLSYNSHAWHFETDNDCTVSDPIGCQHWATGITTAMPDTRSNAAFGWTISLGRLFLPGDVRNPANQGTGGLTVEDPDGATHTTNYAGNLPIVGVFFTDDNSYIRGRVEAADYSLVHVDFPDGTTQEFSYGKLTRITDATGNAVTVSYSSDSTHPEIWTISDAARQSSQAIVVRFADSGLTSIPHVIESVTVPAPDGGTSTWNFEVRQATMRKPPGDDMLGTVDVPVLTAVTPPDGTKYSMTLDDSASTPAYNLTSIATPGCLGHLRLPTGAAIDWTFDKREPDVHRRAYSPGVEQPSAVIKRQIDDPSNPVDIDHRPTWTYDMDSLFGPACVDSHWVPHVRERRSSVHRPDGTTEVAHYSLYDSQLDTCTATGWSDSEYGLPLTHLGAGRSDPSYPNNDAEWLQFLSTETFDTSGARLQARYVRYEGDPLPSMLWKQDNMRVLTDTTYCEADCPGVTPSPYVSTHRYQYRDFGNYARTLTTGNLNRFDQRTVFRNHSAVRPYETSPWIVGLPSEECVSDSDPGDIAGCSQLPGAFTTKYDYDTIRNQIRHRRVLAGVGNSSSDLLSTYTYDSRGNLSEEAFAGGDGSGLATTSDFPAVTPQYRILYDWTYNVAGAPEAVATHYNGFNFTKANVKIDPAIGLVTESRDGAGLLTRYYYDPALRLTKIAPPGVGPTLYNYTNAALGTSFTPAKIAVTAKSTLGPDLKHDSYEYDGLGRLWHEITYPDGVASTRTTLYDAMSHVVRISPFEITPSHWTETTYDAMGRAKTTTSPDGYVTSFSYVGAGQTTRTVNIDTATPPAQAVTIEQSDSFGRLIYVRDPVQTEARYTYDAAGHLVTAQISDPAQPEASRTQARTFEYDHRGFLLAETHPENGRVSFTYDSRGHVLTKNLAQSSKYDLTYRYDGAERLLEVQSRTAPNSSLFKMAKVFSFADADGQYKEHSDHAAGKLSQATRHNYQAIGDVQVRESYHYTDDAGHPTDRVTDILLDGVLKQTFTQSTSYNDLGLPFYTTYPACGTAPGCGSRPWEIVPHIYNEGRLSEISGIASMTYSPNGMLHTIEHTNGVTDTITPPDNHMVRPRFIDVTGGHACAQPIITNQPVDQTIASGSTATVTFTASGSEALSIQWYSSATGAIAGANNWSYTTSTLSQDASYYAVVSNGCGTATTRIVTVTVTGCAAPVITNQPQNATVATGSRHTLSITATGAVSYRWFHDGDGQELPGSGGATFTTEPLYSTTAYRVRVYSACFGYADSVLVTVYVPPAAPTNLVATAAGNQVTILWTPPATGGVDHYKLEHLVGGVWTELVQDFTTTSASESFGAIDTAQFYRVRAVDAFGVKGAYSNADVATYTNFTSIAVGSVVTASPLNELLTAVNAMRRAGNIPVLQWADILTPGVSAPGGGVSGSTVHVSALRSAMDAVLQQFGISAVPYTDPALPGTPLRLVHIAELRSRAQ